MNGSMACTNITILEDEAKDCEHYFFVELIGPTSPPVTIGTPDNVTVTIIDNDSEFNCDGSVAVLLSIIVQVCNLNITIIRGRAKGELTGASASPESYPEIFLAMKLKTTCNLPF